MVSSFLLILWMNAPPGDGGSLDESVGWCKLGAVDSISSPKVFG